MNPRMNRILVGVLAGAGLLTASCNPFPEATKGSPQIVRALVFDSAPGDGQDPVSEAVLTGGTYLVSNAYQGSYGFTYAGAARPGKRVGLAVEVEFNKPLDGATVQATPADCTPALGSFTFPTAAAGEAWYACYNPGNPDVTVGGTIIFFKSQTTPASRKNDPRIAVYEAATQYHITGTVKDQDGNAVGVDVTFNTSAEKLDPLGYSNNGGFSLTPNAGGTITVDWVGDAGGVPDQAQSYDIERAGNVVDPFNGDTPGAFATVTTGIPAATLTYLDTPGGLAGTKYWYRMTVHGTNGTVVTGLPDIKATLP